MRYGEDEIRQAFVLQQVLVDWLTSWNRLERTTMLYVGHD